MTTHFFPSLKSMTVLLTVFLLVACSENDPAQKPSAGGGAENGQDEGQNPVPPPTLPESLTLVAKKEYGPSRWTDGVWDENVDLGDDVQFQVTVPSQINVTSGNAGNHQMTVRFDKDSNNVVCTYKGGADISKPIQSGNPIQITKGLKYHFQSCSNGTLSGELVTVNQTIHVSVGNGDSTATTQVTVELTVSAIVD